MISLISIVVAITAAFSVFYDFRWRIIPNYITLGALAAGILLHTLGEGYPGFYNAVTGAFLGSGLFLLLFFFGWMGAGDVKLAAAFGALLAGKEILAAVFFTILVGGLLGISYLVLAKIKKINPVPTVPYGVAISIGTIGYLILR